MAKRPEIKIKQIDQVIDQLISQLFAFKKTIAGLREKVAATSDSAQSDEILNDAQIAALLNKREKSRQKRSGKYLKFANKFANKNSKK